MEEEFYAPYQIRFTTSQIVWLLRYLDLLKDGRWPPGEPDDIITRRGVEGRSYFEIPVTIAAEIDIRLEKTGDDGFILKDRFCFEQDKRTLSRKYHLSVEDIEMRIRRGLRFMSGEARKKITYQEFINHRREKYRIPKLTATQKPGILTP